MSNNKRKCNVIAFAYEIESHVFHREFLKYKAMISDIEPCEDDCTVIYFIYIVINVIIHYYTNENIHFAIVQAVK